MSHSKDKAASTPGTPRPAGEPKQSGRVAFDARGNPIWEWQTATGVFDRNVSTQRLKKLEAQDLKLAETQSLPMPKGLSLEAPAQMPGGGFNPYDSGCSQTSHSPKSATPVHKKMASSRPQLAQPGQSSWNKLKGKLFGKS